MNNRYKFVIPISVILVIALILFFIQIHHHREVSQNQQTEKQDPSRENDSQEPSPDQSAFYSTYAIREPEERLDALKEFIGDYPESPQVWSAYREIFKLTIEIWPDDRGKMLESAAPAETVENIIDKSSGYQFIAKELFKAEIFLDDAENYASKSISFLDKDRFIENQKRNIMENEQPVPSDAEMNEEYLKEMAEYRTTLGRIYLEKGRVSEGEEILQEAYNVDPLIAQAAIGLAEIAESRGENTKALDYLTTAALTAGYEMEDARSRIEALYLRTHEGSLDGMETMLDAAYRRLFPNPVEIEPYLPTDARSGRVVLAEFFTGAG
ncbi:MAG: hypothetical protein P8Y80_05290 [Acidobacteriota bacterium]